MDPLKTQSFLETDPACRGRGNKAKIFYKEDSLLKDSLGLDAFQFA